MGCFAYPPLLGPHRDVVFERLDASERALSRDEQVAGSLLAPMSGQVIAVHVTEGDAVEAGDALLVLEAMKMEHTIRAPRPLHDQRPPGILSPRIWPMPKAMPGMMKNTAHR